MRREAAVVAVALRRVEAALRAAVAVAARVLLLSWLLLWNAGANGRAARMGIPPASRMARRRGGLSAVRLLRHSGLSNDLAGCRGISSSIRTAMLPVGLLLLPLLSTSLRAAVRRLATVLLAAVARRRLHWRRVRRRR